MSEIIQVTDDLRLVIEQDLDAGSDDPRTWTPNVQCYAYRVAFLDRPDDMGEATGAAKVFHRIYQDTGDDDLALRTARRYITIVGSTERIDTYSAHGYSQGDWWEVVTVVPNDEWGEPNEHAKTFERWARGDVYVVSAERRAKWARVDENREPVFLTEPTEMETWEDTDDCLGGCYLDDDYPAAEVALDHFELEDDEREALIALLPDARRQRFNETALDAALSLETP